MFGSKKQKLIVDGMMCQHCAAHVAEAISNIEGVKSVKVDLPSKTVVVNVDKPLGKEVYEKAIEEAGYRLTEVRE